MANRMKEQEIKIRTPQCDLVEKECRDNLADIRLLVAKEYCTMLMGLYFFRNSTYWIQKIYFSILYHYIPQAAQTHAAIIIWVIPKRRFLYLTKTLVFLRCCCVCVFKLFGQLWDDNLFIKQVKYKIYNLTIMGYVGHICRIQPQRWTYMVGALLRID